MSFGKAKRVPKLGARKGHAHTDRTKKQISESLKRYHAGRGKSKVRGKRIAAVKKHSAAAMDHAAKAKVAGSPHHARKAKVHAGLAKRFAKKLGKFGKKLLRGSKGPKRATKPAAKPAKKGAVRNFVAKLERKTRGWDKD